MSPTDKYKLLKETDPSALTPDVVRALRAAAEAAGDAEKQRFLTEFVGSATPAKNKSILFG